MKLFHFFGSRVIKTGVAVFLTALLCQWIGWPPVFAVITAIVTIEPTVSDSIKKGLVRFPASAIGSAYAVLFISLFGNSPITYTLAAMLTIATCFKLNLHAGLLVATLTAVAMVEVIHDNLFVSFLIRLGTTTVGLGVSTLVNMFIFPPDYRNHIEKKLKQIKQQTGKQLEGIFLFILRDDSDIHAQLLHCFYTLDQKMEQLDKLIQFQQDETKFHPLLKTEEEQFQLVQKQLQKLRFIHHHLRNLINPQIDNLSWTENERKIIMHAAEALTQSLHDEETFDSDIHNKRLKEITGIFWEDNEEITKNNAHPTYFPPELIILYELVSIYELVEEFYESNL